MVKRKLALIFLLGGIIAPAVGIVLSERNPRPGLSTLLQRQVVLKPGISVTVPGTRTKPAEGPGTLQRDLAEVRQNLRKLADPATGWEEKARVMATADGDFRGLPPSEQQRALRYLETGEVIALYILSSGYRLDTVLGPDHHVGRLAVPVSVFFVAGLIFVSIGVYLLFSRGN